jgi:NADPH:quinone reductase
MRAALYQSQGSPVRVEEVPDPVPESGAIVRMAVASLNPLDGDLWCGRGGIKTPTPHIPGLEGAGYLDGKPVLVFGGGVGIVRSGTLAEQVAVPASCIYPIPDGVPLEHAAMCGAAGATAVRLVELAGATSSDHVLVLGASGVIGTLVVSLLGNLGIRVTAQVRDISRAGPVQRARTRVITMSQPRDMPAAVGAEALTVIIDPLGGQWSAASIEVLAPRGRLINYATISGEAASIDMKSLYRKAATIRGYSGLGEPNEHQRCITAALERARMGQLPLEVARRFSLDDAAAAFACISSGAQGKTLITIDA